MIVCMHASVPISILRIGSVETSFTCETLGFAGLNFESSRNEYFSFTIILLLLKFCTIVKLQVQV